MIIAITGCNGQLGTDCREVLAPLGELSCVDLPNVDISDEPGLKEYLDAAAPDVVVNCAAYTAVDACETEKDACWAANADGPGHLARWCSAHDRFLVHVSTDYVFPGDRALFQPYVETDEPGPVSEYGRSKLAGEIAVRESGCHFAILRTAWLYGARGKNFLKTMLRLAMQEPDRELKVVHDQFGSPTWSRTLAEQIRAVIEHRAEGLFHATSEGYGSWFDLATQFLTLMEQPFRMKPCASEDYPTPAKRPANSILENQRLKERGINVFRDWREDLQTFVDRLGSDLALH
jgi:dTDP-4-dehydrorhamnose reductase